MINLNDYKSIGTHWIALYVNAKTVTYFDSFGVEHIPKEHYLLGALLTYQLFLMKRCAL